MPAQTLNTNGDTDSKEPVYRWLMFTCLVLAGLFLLSNNVADPDLWGHVQFGRDAVRDGGVKATTTYSYTANGYRWINHENLSEVILAVTYDNLGLAGLIVGKFLLALFILGLVIWAALKNQCSKWVAGLVVLLVALNLSGYWHFRPQISSFVYCAIMLFVLEHCFRNWRVGVLGNDEDKELAESKRTEFQRSFKLLWFIPLVLFLWANSHGGFVAGLAIFGAYISGRIIELSVARGRQSYGLGLRLSLIGIAGLLATLVNPYGPDLHFWLINSLGEPRPEIQDWHPVDFTTANGTRFGIMLSVAMIAIAGSKSRKDWTKLAILGLVCWQAYSHVRHVAFVALLFGFWMPVYLQGLGDRLAIFLNTPCLRGTRSSTPEGETYPDQKMPVTNSMPKTSWAYAACAIVLVAMIGNRLRDIPVDKATYPVEAFEFLADNNLSGRMVVTYNWAQYSIGAFGGEHQGLPVCPVSFDGRFRTCYPQEIVDMNFDFIIHAVGPKTRFRGSNSGPVDATRVLDFGKPELVLISRRQLPGIEVMQTQHERWCLLYQDEIAQLWGLRSRFDRPSSPAFVPESQRSISNHQQTGSVTWPALPNAHSLPSGFASR